MLKITKLKNKVETLSKEIERLTQDLNNKQAESAKFQKQFDLQHNTINTLNEECKNLQNTLQAKSNMILILEKEKSDLKDQNEELNEEKIRFHNIYENKYSNLLKMQEENESEKNNSSELKNQVEEMQQTQKQWQHDNPGLPFYCSIHSLDPNSLIYIF